MIKNIIVVNMIKALLSLFLIIALLTNAPIFCYSQDTIKFEWIGEHEFPSQGFFIPSSISNVIDNTGRNYVYTANLHAGMIVFNIDDVTNPVPIDTLSVNAFEGLRPSHVTQQGSLLYVALGGFEGLGTQPAGLAIVDISIPEEPLILSQWDSVAYDKGCPYAHIAEDYAYLAAMEKGIIILDVSNEEEIKFVSQLTLERLFPQKPGLTSEPHARGLDLHGDQLLVAHDAGGFRIVDVSDKHNPYERAMYVNDSMFNTTQVAYNKVAMSNGRAHISTDYCGLEVIDISQLPILEQGDWYNPFECMPNTWQGSPGHTNGIKILEDEELLFMSAGDTEVIVYDMSNEPNLREIGRYANLLDSTVAWSLDVRGDLVVLSCIDNHIFPLQPYYGDFGGIILLKWRRENSSVNNSANTNGIKIYPNPVQRQLNININNDEPLVKKISIINFAGITMDEINQNELSVACKIETSSWPQGTYFIVVQYEERQVVHRFVKTY